MIRGERSWAIREAHVLRVGPDGGATSELDALAVEEPLEIRLAWGPLERRELRTYSVAMRTPGHDRELAAGLLFAEGIVSHGCDLRTILLGRNLARVELSPAVEVDWDRIERRMIATASCGVCGIASPEAIGRAAKKLENSGASIEIGVIAGLPSALLRAQAAFAQTGGLHAAGLFDLQGQLQGLYEDVGRHNALDKLIGSQLLAGHTPLAAHIVFLSGRVSFELVQKCLAAGVPVLAAVGAPSSLAVELAAEGNMTLAGFVRGGRFNLYSGAGRIRSSC